MTLCLYTGHARVDALNRLIKPLTNHMSRSCAFTYDFKDPWNKLEI